MAAIGHTQNRRPAVAVRTPLFIVGTGLALFAFIAMVAVGLVLTKGGQSSAQERVVVAADDIQPRQPITVDLVSYSSVARTAVPPRAITSVSTLTSLYALVEIYKGEILSSNLVASNPDQINSTQEAVLPIPSGDVAVTIPAGEQQAVAGYIVQGDYIDITATADMSQFALNKHGSATVVVFSDVKVIRVGAQTAVARQGQPQGIASSLTVVMSRCDAVYLSWLLTNATVKYDLVSYSDYNVPLAATATSCPASALADGVNAAAVAARWHGFNH